MAAAAKAGKVPNVSRIDQEARRTYGWFVRVTVEGQTLSKFVPDKRHGGKAKALMAAKEHRDKLRAAAAGTGGAAAAGLGKKFLTRLEGGRGAGWKVAVPTGPGKETARTFLDADYPTPAACKTAAVRMRDALAANRAVAAAG